MPFWWEEAPPLERRDDLPDRADVVVIGGGYTGLSAALELARGGVDVTVLEALRFGEGASSRNAGMISSGVTIGKGADTVRRYGRERADAMLREASSAYDFLHELIRRENIDCQLSEPGRFMPAHTPAAYEALARRVDELNRLTDARAYLVERRDQRSELVSDYYYGGMVLERAGGVHPARLVRGLAEAASRAGATLCSETAASGIRRADGGFVVETSAGQMRAGEVMLATNAYTGPVTPWHRRRVFPVSTHIIATEDLGTDGARRYIPNLRTVSDTRRMLAYFRPSPDGRRILFGGRASWRGVDSEGAAPRLRKALGRLFPDLKEIPLTHAWSGQVAITFDRLAHIGNDRGLRYAMGCNGTGVVMMTWLGRKMARAMFAGEEPPSAFAGNEMPTMPFYTGDPWILPAIGAWYVAADRIDRWRARRRNSTG